MAKPLAKEFSSIHGPGAIAVAPGSAKGLDLIVSDIQAVRDKLSHLKGARYEY